MALASFLPCRLSSCFSSSPPTRLDLTAGSSSCCCTLALRPRPDSLICAPSPSSAAALLRSAATAPSSKRASGCRNLCLVPPFGLNRRRHAASPPRRRAPVRRRCHHEPRAHFLSLLAHRPRCCCHWITETDPPRNPVFNYTMSGKYHYDGVRLRGFTKYFFGYTKLTTLRDPYPDRQSSPRILPSTTTSGAPDTPRPSRITSSTSTDDPEHLRKRVPLPSPKTRVTEPSSSTTFVYHYFPRRF
nr:uncharacterized protein LOC120968633 [Aegilops tauschii subsp. strangulata]